MQNFIYKNPTEILFGRGMIAEIAGRVPEDAPVLFLYGGGSIKRNGVYDQVKAALKKHRAVEFGGIEANPFYETCLAAVDVVKRERVGFILAVGGGSVLDPETTFTLPPKQVRNGVVDAIAHVMEQYMTFPADAPLQDRMAESVLQTLVEVGPVTLAEPKNYEARAAFMWSATLALNTLLGCGVPQDWATHMIGHELTAFYGLDHAETLAIVMPGVWQHKLAQKKAKLEQYGRRVWNVASAEAAIEKTEAFFNSIGMPTRLRAYNIAAEEAAAKISGRFAERKATFGEHGDIGPAAAAAILRLRA